MPVQPIVSETRKLHDFEKTLKKLPTNENFVFGFFFVFSTLLKQYFLFYFIKPVYKTGATFVLGVFVISTGFRLTARDTGFRRTAGRPPHVHGGGHGGRAMRMRTTARTPSLLRPTPVPPWPGASTVAVRVRRHVACRCDFTVLRPVALLLRARRAQHTTAELPAGTAGRPTRRSSGTRVIRFGPMRSAAKETTSAARTRRSVDGNRATYCRSWVSSRGRGCTVAGGGQLNVIRPGKGVDLLNINDRSSGAVWTFRILMLRIGWFSFTNGYTVY